MNTQEQALDAVTATIGAILGKSVPPFTNDTKVGALNVPLDDCDDFAQIVSDCLALLPNSEAEVGLIMQVETGRHADDARAMTVGELVQRVARLPDFEG